MTEIRVRLPDGKTLGVPIGSTVLEVAGRIGKGLARAALAGRIDGRLVDLRVPLREDASIEIVTAKDPPIRPARAARARPGPIASAT